MRLSRLQKRLVTALAVLLLAAGAFNLELFRVFHVNPYGLRIEYESISDEKMPASMRDVSVLFISDIEYGEYVHPGHLDEVFGQIRELSPDILLFGGDLFAASTTVDTPSSQMMVDYFDSIPAPLGKFAVYGEQDLISSARKEMIDRIYQQAQIEVISNSSRFISAQGKTGFQLVGIDIVPDVPAAFSGIASTDYTLVFSHYPDNLMLLEESPVSLALAGNAHGTQITYPVYGGYTLWEGSEVLNRASYQELPFSYFLSSGIGCIAINGRFNAKPAFTYFLIN